MNATPIYIIVIVLAVLWALLGVYVFSEVKKTYIRNGTFTNKLLGWWFAMWGIYIAAMSLASFNGMWLIPVDKASALIAGSVLVLAGAILLAAGMMEFRTLRRSCGQDTSKLITSGVYRWSRNPQFIGCLLYLIGMSLAGRSMFAFILTAAASAVICWYTVYLAEPYLERLYGEDYRLYRRQTSRWLGMPS